MTKVPLPDVAFLLVARFDSIQRLENALAVSEYLSNTFDTNIYLWEFDKYDNHIFQRLKTENVQYTFCKDRDPILHRTRFINQMLDSTAELFIAIWDVDVIVPPKQVFQAIELLQKGVDFVYPYEHYFYDTSEAIRNLYLKTKDIGLLHQYKGFMNELYAPNPVGGVFLARRESYIKTGKENELFYGWGVEDGERYYRWKNKGMKIERVKGPLFHLTHPRGINSVIATPDDSLAKSRLRLKSMKKTAWNER